MQSRTHFLRYILAAFILSYILFWLPLPYVVLQPGIAENLDGLVKSEQQGNDEGDFYLTTIRMSYPQANLAAVVKAMFAKYAIIADKDEIYEGETEQGYTRRQEYIMLNSQSNALQAAYRHADIKYVIETSGVVVMRVIENSNSEGVLRSGDRIVKIDGKDIQTRDQLMTYIADQSVGDSLQITFQRNQTGTLTESIELTDLAKISPVEQETSESQTPKPGLGVTLIELKKIRTDLPQQQVEISANEIGGPSAGLMFALEIYNRLVEQDIAKGYKIAGTGTITANGEVGVIGGIDFKVVAADRIGADLFFAPKDYEFKESGREPILNATLAQKQAEELDTKMKIVPVGTLQEALDFLEALPPKGN